VTTFLHDTIEPLTIKFLSCSGDMAQVTIVLIAVGILEENLLNFAGP